MNKQGRKRPLEREREVKGIEVKGIERVNGAQIKILVKSSNREVKRKESLNTKIMCNNYEQKLLQEIFTGNYDRKLSASIYHHAKNVGIIGILAYLKIEENTYHFLLYNKVLTKISKTIKECFIV